MKRSTQAIAAIALFALLLVACAQQEAPPAPATSGLEVGDHAPSFTLPSATGGTVRLADFRGRQPVLLYFSMGPG